MWKWCGRNVACQLPSCRSTVESATLCIKAEEGRVARKRLRLIQRRKALGLTQEALAEKVGCDRTTIIRWERGETEPQPWVRPQLGRALDLAPDELSELLADISDVPGAGDEFSLVTSVSQDFPLSAADTMRVMEGFSAHDIASRREALACLIGLGASTAVMTIGLDAGEHVAAALDDARRYLDGSVVGYFRQQLDRCKTDDGSLGPARALPLVLGILGAITQHVREVKPDVRFQLLSLGA